MAASIAILGIPRGHDRVLLRRAWYGVLGLMVVRGIDKQPSCQRRPGCLRRSRTKSYLNLYRTHLRPSGLGCCDQPSVSLGPAAGTYIARWTGARRVVETSSHLCPDADAIDRDGVGGGEGECR